MTGDASQVHVLDLAAVLVQRRRKILLAVFIAVAVAAVISLLLPPSYTATTTVLPPEPLGVGFGLGPVPQMSFGGLSLVPNTSTSDLLVEFLKSREVLGAVLGKRYQFKGKVERLYEILGYDSLGLALAVEQHFAKFSVGEQGVIQVEVTLPTADLAARVANDFVREADRVRLEKTTSRAKRSRLYIESQLRSTEKSLDSLSSALVEFQRQHGLVALDRQVESFVERLGVLEGRIAAKRIELGVLGSTMEETNPTLLAVRSELEVLERAYLEMLQGQAMPDSGAPGFSLETIPRLARELAELKRRLKVQETLWSLLNQQYYQAKIEEAKDTPTLQVLDRATPPVFRSAPKRKLIVLLSAAFAFLISILWAFVDHYWARTRGTAERDKWIQLYSYIQADIRDLRHLIFALIRRGRA